MRTQDKVPAASKKIGRVLKMPSKQRAVSGGAEDNRHKDRVKAAGVKPDRLSISRNKSLSYVTAVFFGFVLIYMLQIVISFAFKSHTVIERIEFGSIMSPVELTGIILRDEKVYRSGSSGTVRFSVTENERVRKGDTVCSIQNTDEVNRINTELMDINEELLRVQTMRFNNGDLNGNGKRLNLLMKNMVDDWAGMKACDFSSLYSLKDNLSVNVERRNQLILSDSSESLKEQHRKRQIYQEELSKYMTLVTADESGIVSSLMDGHEETYTLNIKDKLFKEYMLPNSGDVILQTVKTAEPETPIFKIICSNVWYIACYIPNDIIEGWKENDAKTILIDYFSLPVTVERIAEEGNESYVLLKCTRYLEKYLCSRQLRFRISGDNSQGLKIPHSAIANKTLIPIPREYISILDDQIKSAKLVKSGGEIITLAYTAIDDDMVYVDPDNGFISLGTEIRNPADAETKFLLNEKVELTGVYRVNYGTADFRKVVINDESRTVDYYILDPGLNKGLQEKDSIVHDASSVKKEGDIINFLR